MALFEWLPSGALTMAKEAARILLRRPFVGVAVVATRGNGDVLLIKRGDTGQWGLPGGVLEWGETLHQNLERELAEETGCPLLQAGRLVGVYAAPERDPRVHAVTVLVEAKVGDEAAGAENPLEVTDVAFFAPDQVPRPLSFGAEELVDHALSGAEPVWE